MTLSINDTEKQRYGIMLSVIIVWHLFIIMLNVNMLSVVAPRQHHRYSSWFKESILWLICIIKIKLWFFPFLFTTRMLFSFHSPFFIPELMRGLMRVLYFMLCSQLLYPLFNHLYYKCVRIIIYYFNDSGLCFTIVNYASVWSVM